MKVCTTCGVEKPCEEFSPKQARCHACRNDLAREQRRAQTSALCLCGCGDPQIMASFRKGHRRRGVAGYLGHTELAAGYSSPCWESGRGRTTHGYVELSQNGRRQYVHRVAWEQAHGPIPDGLCIDHLCRNRWCINPAHMEVVTPAENTRRGRRHYSERTHCSKGHSFADRGWWNGRQRVCRECGRLRSRAKRAALKAARAVL